MAAERRGTPPDPVDPPPPLASAVVVPVALAVAAGFVDSVSFLHLFGVFPANQSGNAVLLGMALPGAGPTPAWTAATAMVGFALGAAGAWWLARRLPPERRPLVLLGVELGLLAVVVLAMVLAPDGVDRLAAPLRAGVLLVAALAMGTQTEAIRRAAGVAVSTTFQTGAITRIGEAVALPPGTPERTDANRTLVVLGAVLAGYVGGAALGATGVGDGRSGLAAPCVLVAAALVVTSRGAIGDHDHPAH